MKNILVPTDFSTNAAHALQYAVLLAKKHKSKITLLHTWLSTGESSIAASVVVASHIIKERYEKKLAKLCEKYKTIYKVEFNYIAEEGGFYPLVKKIIKHKKINLVVMGTKGAGRTRNRWFGSNAAGMIEKADCPVVVIPQKAVLNTPRQVVFATDYYKDDLKKLKALLKLIQPFNPLIEVIHVTSPMDIPTERLFIEDFANKVKKNISYKKIKFKLVMGNNITNTLEKYARDKKVHLIGMSSAQRGLFERIFISSITKRLSYRNTVPILIFHQKR